MAISERLKGRIEGWVLASLVGLAAAVYSVSPPDNKVNKIIVDPAFQGIDSLNSSPLPETVKNIGILVIGITSFPALSGAVTGKIYNFNNINPSGYKEFVIDTQGTATAIAPTPEPTGTPAP